MLTLGQLEQAAREVRVERLQAGKPLAGKRRIRPRSPEKLALLRQACRDRLEKYPPRYENGVLVLPYYRNPE